MPREAAERIYTLDDLGAWSFPGTSLAVLGKPIKHSISPQMHNAALAELAGQDAAFGSWRYFRFEIDPADLASALPLFFKRGFLGLNLTVPHKEIAFHAIDDISHTALPIGAVNTLLRTPKGYKGYNTDGYGLRKGIDSALSRSLANAPVVLLGAGGAARAAAFEALESRCHSLSIINRNPERLAALRAALAPRASELGIALATLSPSRADRLPPGSLIVNATSLGLKPSDPTPIPPEILPADAALYDMIYNPAETTLMAAAQRRGLATANGLSMLVHQGARALEIWSKQATPAERMRKAAQHALDTEH